MEVRGGPSNRKHRKRPDPLWLQFMSDDEKERRRIEEWQAVPLADVGLPVRIANTLENHSIFTVGDLANLTAENLTQIPNLGDLTIRRCVKLLHELNIPNRLNK